MAKCASMGARRLALAACAAGLAGCQSLSCYQDARAMDPGQLEVSAAPSAFMIGPQPGHASVASEPGVEVSARYGLGHQVDVGARVYTLGAELTSTIQLEHSERVDVAVAPSVGYYGFGSNGRDDVELGSFSAVPVRVPLLVGVNVGEDDQLVLGPTVIASGFDAPGMPRLGVLAGGTLGVSLRVGRSVRVTPALAAFVPVIDSPLFNLGFDPGRQVGPLLQAGLGISFDTSPRSL